MKYQVLLFYKYVNVNNPEELKAYSLELCKKYNLTGRVIIAEEGINYTLEGLVEDTEKVLKMCINFTVGYIPIWKNTPDKIFLEHFIRMIIV